MPSLQSVLFVVLAGVCSQTAPGTGMSAVDPVTQFIVTADSLAAAGGENALITYVSDRGILVGAVVAQLLDVAFQVGEEGNESGEAENVDFAERIARIHSDHNGSSVPLELVATYRNWDADMRDTRVRADTLHERGNADARGDDPDTAVEELRQALDLYERIGDQHSVAVVWGSLGVAHWYRGDLEAVKTQYENALAARRAVEDRILEGKTLNGLGSVYFRLGDLPAAADYYKQAIDLRRRTGDLSGLGTSLTYLGHVYFNLDRLVDARDQYEQALPILEAMGSASQMVDVTIGVANSYSAMGRIERANKTYLRAVELARAAGEVEKEINCRLNLADNHRLAGRYGEAYAELDAVEGLLEKHPDKHQQAVFFQFRGLVDGDVGNIESARENHLRSLELAKELGHPALQMEALLNIGYLYRELGALERGTEITQRAKALAEQHADGRQYRQAVALLADLERRRGNFEASLEGWNEALAQDEYDQSKYNVLEDKVSIASLHAAMGDNAEARRLSYEILPDIREVGSVYWEMAVQFGIGHSFEKENADSAAFHYEEALSLVERSRATLTADESRSEFLSGKYRRFFEEVARYYASLDAGAAGEWSERAFATVERAKARGLLDLIEISEASRTSNGEESVLDELYRLDPQSPDYAAERERLEAEYNALRDKRMQGAVGALAAAQRPTSIGDVREALSKKTVMLQYALGDTVSLLWVIDRNGHDLVTIPNRGVIKPEVLRLRDAIAHPGPGDAALLSSARDLYEHLVAPAGRRLEKAKCVIIVPDGILHEVPFDALLAGDPKNASGWETQPFLARSFATVYAPSAAIYLKLHEQKKRRYEFDLVAFGSPDYSLLAAGGPDGEAFEPLPYARAEVEEISHDVKEKKRRVLLGADANETEFKDQMKNGSTRVLHLATHGVVNPVEPEASSVVLCPDPAGVDDGYLRTREILSSKTDAGIVVVSACETALGRISRGEGVEGLSRAFIASGAGGVVASLWAVSDESTSELMKEFYEHMLKEKRPAAVALQQARLALVDGGRFAHPYYWSPFIVIGTDKSPW
jgi:CHAT domain-containing protein/Tfp pilus assembly protein PilF